MNRVIAYGVLVMAFVVFNSCNEASNMKVDSEVKDLELEVYETSASGNKLTLISEFLDNEDTASIKILPEQKFQTITGFGGSFTESTAYLLNQVSEEKRKEIIDAYFSSKGANYSLTRTHINSCDFSLSNYSYAPVEDDKSLEHFSIDEDRDDIIPLIKEAKSVSEDGFKILSSPWTAPPWMKDNKEWVGGKLLPEYFDTWGIVFLEIHCGVQK